VTLGIRAAKGEAFDDGALRSAIARETATIASFAREPMAGVDTTGEAHPSCSRV
jgi:hypothetical protein